MLGAVMEHSLPPNAAKSAPPPCWLPTDAWVRLLLVPFLVFVALASNTSYLADFWHHLARGRYIVIHGRLLDHDIFTFTVQGTTLQDVNWLSQVIYFLLYEQGGLALVQVVNALVMALTLGWLVRLCGRLSGSLVVGMAVGIAVFLGLWQVLTVRPQTFSLLLFVALFDVLIRSERRPWMLVLPTIFLALWANLHGAFPAGLMLVGCFLVADMLLACKRGRLVRDRRSWQLAVCLVACVLATLANPYGWRIYAYVGETSSRAAARRIDEWVPPGFDQLIGIGFFASLILLAALLVLAWKRRSYRPELRDLVLVLCFLPLAAASVRMVAWWLLATAPLAAVLVAQLTPAASSTENKPTVGATLTCAGLLLLAVFSLPGLQGYNPLMAMRSSERIEHDLDAVLEKLGQERVRREQNAPGRIFMRFEWGEYFTWAAAPRFLVFMDGRIEIYPDQVWKDYEAVTTGRDWARILDDYQVDALVLDSDYAPHQKLMTELGSSPHWVRASQARTAVLFLAKSHAEAQNAMK
jgi:hypothetical protein